MPTKVTTAAVALLWTACHGNPEPSHPRQEHFLCDSRVDDPGRPIAVDGHYASASHSEHSRLYLVNANQISVWDLESLSQVQSAPLPPGMHRPLFAEVSADGATLAVQGQWRSEADGTERRTYVVSLGEEQPALIEAADAPFDFSREGLELRGPSFRWSNENGTEAFETRRQWIPHSDNHIEFEPTPDGSFLPILHRFDDNSTVHLPQTKTATIGVSGDGETLAIVSNQSLIVFGSERGTEEHRFPIPEGIVRVALSSDGNLAALTGEVCTIPLSGDAPQECPPPELSLWDVGSGQVQWVRPHNGHPVRFSESDRFIHALFDWELSDAAIEATTGAKLTFPGRIRELAANDTIALVDEADETRLIPIAPPSNEPCPELSRRSRLEP